MGTRRRPRLLRPPAATFDENGSNGLAALCARVQDNLGGGRRGGLRYPTSLVALGEPLADERLQVAVRGQFEPGMSTFLNALLGAPVLPTEACL